MEDGFGAGLAIIIGVSVIGGTVYHINAKRYERTRPVVRGTVIDIDASDPQNYKILIDTDGDHTTAELVMETGVSNAYKRFQKSGRHDLADMCMKNNEHILKDLDQKLVRGTVLEMRVHEPKGTVPKTVMSYEIVNPDISTYVKN